LDIRRLHKNYYVINIYPDLNSYLNSNVFISTNKPSATTKNERKKKEEKKQGIPLSNIFIQLKITSIDHTLLAWFDCHFVYHSGLVRGMIKYFFIVVLTFSSEMRVIYH